MRAAARADDLGPAHAVASVRAQLDLVGTLRLGEARPSRAGFELGVRAEQLVATGSAAVDPVFLRIGVLATEGRLRSLAAKDLVLLGSELLAPLLLGLRHF